MSYRDDEREQNFRFARHTTITAVIAVTGLIAIVLGCMWGFKAYGRYQAVQDAKNQVKTSQIKANNQVELSNIQIRNQAQRVKIAQQQAQIRLQNAIGVREAQDKIAQTLTPLYVQFEMTEALKEIALSGKNSSVIYIPTGADGLPVVANASKK